MEQYYKEILALLGFALAVYGYLVKFHESKTKGRELKELKEKFLSSSMLIDLADLNAIREIVDFIFKDTQIDRFLLLSAVNGKEEINFVSALYEQHDVHKGGRLSIGLTSKIIDVKVDDVYRTMIKSIEKVKPFVSSVASMEDGLLKNIYLSESVKHTAVFFLVRQTLDEKNDRLVYLSWSTHADDPIDTDTFLRIQGATNKIKHLFS